jgi:PAS domain S-box-containing protein
MAHGYCLLWKPWLVTLHAGSDLLIFGAYSAIPIAIWIFLRKRKDLELKPLAALFAAFIFLCGLTHLAQMATLWWPIYETQGWIKLVTAAVSVATAIAIFPLIPRALAIPSPHQLQLVNMGLEEEVDAHRRTLRQLERARQELEERVADRTAELARAKSRFEALVRASAQVVWTADASGMVREDSESWREFTGQTVEEWLESGWLDAIHPDDRVATLAAWRRAIELREMYAVEYRVQHVSGEWRWTEAKSVPLMNGDGTIAEWVGMNTDITDRKHAEDELARLNESLEARVQERTAQLEAEAERRREAETRLLQSQKMESVGQLAGGIAHDFNNALQVIIGSIDRVERRLATRPDRISTAELSSQVDRPLAMAMQAAQNAAQLTHRLLAFSRRQPLEPKTLNVNQLLNSLSDMLSRTLGEAFHVETIGGAGLWPIMADANQLENVIINLALNARDAMPGGGRLTIETSNTYLDDDYAREAGDVPPGQYVLLAVTDTGTGMSKDVLERVFEPFFTTKGIGEGTGLGLAMVYGFVKQSGGHIRIYSELGQGTTVKLYFPRGRATQAGRPSDPKPDTGALPRANLGESILVVEDNSGVRAHTVGALEELGYTVVAFGDGLEALEFLKQNPGQRFDLLFSDVVLPGGLNGRQLSDRVRKLRPDIGVLFTTGSTPNAIIHHGRLDADVSLLGKPFRLDQLARRVRESIDCAGQTVDTATGRTSSRKLL